MINKINPIRPETVNAYSAASLSASSKQKAQKKSKKTKDISEESSVKQPSIENAYTFESIDNTAGEDPDSMREDWIKEYIDYADFE